MNRSLRLRRLASVCVVACLLCACDDAQTRKASHLSHGKEYLAAGNYDKARVEFRNAQQIDPKDAEPLFRLGQLAQKQEDISAALGYYQAAVGLDPKLAAARAAWARLLLLGGLVDIAMEQVKPGLVINPKNPELLTVRGAARARLGDTAGAFEDAQTAIQLVPDDQYAIALLASLYQRRSQPDKATAVVQSGLQLLPKNADLREILADLELQQQQPAAAEAQLRAIVEMEPKVLTHRYRLARFYVEQKNVDAAEETLRAAMQSQPESLEAKLELVKLLAAQRGEEQAAALVDQLIAAEPGNDKLKLALGEFLAQNGHRDSAESQFRAVIAHAGIRADGLAARDRLASLLIVRGDSPAAAVQIAEVLGQSARDADALTLRAEISLAQGQTQSAINDLRAVLRDQPNAVAVARTLALAYQQNSELDQAEQTLRAAVQGSPDDFLSRLQLSHVLTNAGKLDQAGPLLEQLAKEDPSSVPVQESLFRVQAALKQITQARATAQNVERLKPDAALGYYLAGLVDELDQKPDAAAKDYELSLQREPDAGEPLTALVRLNVRLKRLPAAMALIDGVIARSPSDYQARNLKGEVMLAQGQTSAAIATGQETVQTAPNWPQGYQSLAIALMEAQRYDDAIRSLQQGIEKTHADTLVGALSRLYERLGRVDDAIALYESCIARNPQSSFAINNLAMLLVTHKQDPASLARAQQLSDQVASSTEVNVIDTRGWVRFKRGDFHGAESLLQEAVDKAPAVPELRYHLAMAQLRSGEQQAGQQNLEIAVGSDRPFVGKDEAKAALAKLKRTPSVG